ERANRSIQLLKCTLEETADVESKLDFSLLSSLKGTELATCKPPRGGTDGSMAWQDLQHSHAVNQLRLLLRQQEEKEVEGSPSRSRKMSPPGNHQRNPKDSTVPAVEDLVPIIHNQSEYIQHLEAEVKFCKEELSGMKQRVCVVVFENEKLHDELKSKVMEDSLREQTLLDVSGNLPKTNAQTATITGGGATRRQEENPPSLYNRQQVTTPSASAHPQAQERLKVLYQAKTEALEAQVMSLRKDLSESQKDCEALKGRLRHQESLVAMDSSSRVAGLCLKCAQHEAVLAQTHTNVHMKTIERLSRERDELIDALGSTRSNMNEMQQRESNAYQQVKQAVEMAEEANLEKTKALVQCEQLRNEILRQKDRLERELALQQEKIVTAREIVREEMKRDKEELASMVMSLSQNVATLEAQLERLSREKTSVGSQLEEAQKQLAAQQAELNQASGELRYQLNQMKLKKDEMEKELREHRSKTVRELEMKDQELEKLGLELSETRRRLEHAQQESARAKDECLGLTELLGKSEHQLHLTRLEKDSVVRNHSDEVKALALQVQHREQELTQKIQQMEAQHDKTVNKLESLLSSQNALMIKLKEECQTLGKKLEHIMEKNRSEIGQLSQENNYLHEKVEKLQKRNEELERQCVQHGQMHEKMKQRLHQLDQHCQANAQQVVDLLSKQNQLLKERMALTEQVENLTAQQAERHSKHSRMGEEDSRLLHQAIGSLTY
uniref:SHH signaling and ciliosis regulator SDCCAG8 n=1 Tax=Latimeria chalumnae TaxID=7897 RepID=H3B2R5_LATCH